MDFDDEFEYQFGVDDAATSHHGEDEEEEERDFENLQDDFREGASEEQINEEEVHFQQNIKPHILDTIQLLTSFIIFKDDEELSFEENTQVYAAKRKACIESLQDLQEITKEDLTKRERRVWTLLMEVNIHRNELFSLLSHHRNDYDIVREVVDFLIILSESPDQNNPRFRKFSARGGATERKRAIFYFGKQMKMLQRLKQSLLETKYIPIITWTLLNKEKDSSIKSKMTLEEENKRKVLTEADHYSITIFKLLNNLLSIPDAKHGKVLQTEELQTRMQDVLVKQLQNDCQFLDYALVKMTKFIENYNEVSSQSEMKRLSESYLIFVKFATMLFWNESVKDLFETSNPVYPTSNTEIVMSQNEENMEMDNSELKRLLRKEKMYKDQVKSLILTSRHSRFQGNLLERQSNVSKVITKNKNEQKISALLEEDEEYDAEKENKKNDVKIQNTFVVQNINHMNTAHMYAASDNPFLVGGGQQKASSTGARFGSKRFNVMSDKMELRFSASSLETRKIIKNFADDLYRGCVNTLIQLALQTIIKQQEDSIAIHNELDQKSTKESLDHESERNFLFLGQFMLGYNRYKYLQKKKREEQRSSGETVGFDIALISNLLKEGVVSMIFKKLLSDYFYMQNNFNLTFVVGFLRELFTTFRWMSDKSYSLSDALTWGRIVSVHLHHILYDPTNMESIVRLVREYKPYQNSIKHLSHLILLVDLFVTVINENISIESFFMKSKKGESSTGDENEEEQEDDDATQQRRFELNVFRRRFANPTVLKQYMYLFRFYDVNPPEVNHAIIQIFKYLIEELDMEFMMFRASFLKLCFNILSNKTFINDSLGSFERKVNEEVIEFVLSVVKNFFKRVDEDPFTVCETLHWSTMGEVNLLNNADYGKASRPAEADDLDGFVQNQSEEEEDALEAIRRDEARGVEDEDEAPVQKETKKKNKKKKNKKNKKKRESEETENQEENKEETNEDDQEEKKSKKKKKKKKKSKKRKEREETEEVNEEPNEEPKKKKKKKKKKSKEVEPEESLQEEEPPVEEEMADEERLLLSSDDSDEEKSRGRLKKVSKRSILPASIMNLDFEEE